MRKQTKFTFQIGYAAQHQEFELAIIRAASRVCGGCTTTTKQGWWAAYDDCNCDTFVGDPELEHCFELELTCEEAKAERAYRDVQLAICEAVARWGVQVNWVHVTETEMRGRHFSVAAINEVLAGVTAA